MDSRDVELSSDRSEFVVSANLDNPVRKRTVTPAIVIRPILWQPLFSCIYDNADSARKMHLVTDSLEGGADENSPD